jgi:hypothetical protein
LEAVRQELLMVLRDHPQGARIDEDITEALSFIQAPG